MDVVNWVAIHRVSSGPNRPFVSTSIYGSSAYLPRDNYVSGRALASGDMCRKASFFVLKNHTITSEENTQVHWILAIPQHRVSVQWEGKEGETSSQQRLAGGQQSLKLDDSWRRRGQKTFRDERGTDGKRSNTKEQSVGRGPDLHGRVRTTPRKGGTVVGKITK